MSDIYVERPQDETKAVRIDSQELSIEELLTLIEQLQERAELWLSTSRTNLINDIVENGTINPKREAIQWLQEHGWGSDRPSEKLWIYYKVLFFNFDERGEEYDEKIRINLNTKLGVMLSTLPEGHLMFDFFELVTYPDGELDEEIVSEG